MIRFLLRFLGLWILAAGFIFLIYDGTKSIAGNALFLTKVQDVWGSVHQASLLSLKPKLMGISGVLWDPVMTTFLDQPIALVLGVLGALMMLLGRKKRPLIGYGR
jgi:ABC-type phosphate transport system permease subunit